MTRTKAIIEAQRLYLKWVGEITILHKLGGISACDPDSLDRARESMLREHRWHRTGRSTASAGCQRETRYDLITLGKVRKALATEGGQ